MTFRQVLDVLWQRRALIAVTIALVLVGALVFLSQQVPTYTSTSTVRLSAAATAAYDGSGYSGIDLDVDAETITSPTVLDPAAASLGLDDGAALGPVTATVVEGVRTNRIEIEASGATATEAERNANAVADAWVTYLGEQVDGAERRLQRQVRDIEEEVTVLQRQVTANPLDQVATTNLASAVSRLGEVNSEIADIEDAGEPAVILKRATRGVSDATPVPTVLALGLLIGLIAGAGIALIRDQFDERLRTESEIEDIAAAPMLGELVLERRKGEENSVLPAADRRHTAFNEGVRALRTSLQVLVPASRCVLVVTSPEPGDGKTYVTANLAVSWARTGKRVVLVGGDLRRPRIGAYFDGLDGQPGFADLADASTPPSRGEVAAALQPTDFEGLTILPAGTPPHDPADLLAKQQSRAVIEHLRNLADVVIIDTPPVLALTDATLLASMADGAAVLTSARRTTRATLGEAVKTLRANHVNVLGVILNRSRRKLPKSYRAYYLGDDASPRRSQTSEPQDTTDPADPQAAVGGDGRPTGPDAARAMPPEVAPPATRADAPGDGQPSEQPAERPGATWSLAAKFPSAAEDDYPGSSADR